ncbi:transcription factor kayak isoform X2 [Daktulosphaira vitifoliae]|uniref:transcription factor kayak isoform X2 n=1 Tax=Daktulosphaira vitifoliae TaxID=58002 RepID=UPI0021AA9CDD|nr:transcription factor kayak isoform X2 [Daktulosphaira vitifoliae]
MFTSQQQQQVQFRHTDVLLSVSKQNVLPPPPPAVPIARHLVVSSSMSNLNNNPSITSSILTLDGLNGTAGGGVPTRTTPTLTPTTLRTIADSLCEGGSTNFVVDFGQSSSSATADLHHLLMDSSGNQQQQQQHNHQDSHHRYSIASGVYDINTAGGPSPLINNNNSNNSRQAGFVPPLVHHTNQLQPLIQSQNNNQSVLVNAKSWQGVVTTTTNATALTSLSQQNTVPKYQKEMTTTEDDDDTSDSDVSTKPKRKTPLRNSNGRQSGNINKKGASKSSGNSSGTSGGRRPNSDNKDKVLSAEEEHRRQVRRERNKLAAARCRKRRMDHTNELLEETEQLEEKRMRLQVEIEALRQQKQDLQQLLTEHKRQCRVKVEPMADCIDDKSNIIIDSSLLNSAPTILHTPIVTAVSSASAAAIRRVQPAVRPTTLLRLNETVQTPRSQPQQRNNVQKVELNFDSLMDGGTGLTPVTSSTTSSLVAMQQGGSTVS